MPKISVTIITKNEEKNIRRCLESVKWADEIIVLDSDSVDKTKDICLEFNCKFIVSPWLGFGKMKSLAVDNASNDWILSIDADEVLTPELANEIKYLLSSEPGLCGFKIKRRSFYLGKLIRHCGWNKDYTLRLFDKKYGNFNDKTVHEFVELDGPTGLLKHVMLHYTYPTLESHFDKMRHYARLGAEILHKKNLKSTPCLAIIRGFFKFMKMYFLQLGFLDGKIGFILSENSGWGVYYKYLLLWEMNKSKSST